MGGSRLNVYLYRDSFNTPWGFRLQGGKDLNQPLIVQRVFSNSPAEGELQRGDVILSINARDATQLTHKQAQDLIKHGGGQVQLIVSRPPPGTQVAPLSPPIVTQQPRAPTLQGPRYRPHPAQPQIPHSTPKQRQPNYNNAPMYVTIQDRRRSSHSQPPTTPTTPPPPWATQQAAPKRVTRLSRLGGGSAGFNFGTDFATMPRSRSQAHYNSGGYRPSAPREADSQDGSGRAGSVEPERLASGPVPRVCNLRNLGGGGYLMGSDFGGTSTLPRRSQSRRHSQPPSMPGAQRYGHMPTKVTLNRLGGGGPDFGSTFSPRVQQTPAQRVQTSLDNITLSPRTPEASQGSPFFQQSQPQWEQPQQQVYTPTSLLLEQQMLQQQQQQEQNQGYQDEGEEPIMSVWERRQKYLQEQETEVRTPLHQPPPRVPRPKPGPTSYSNYGTDYSKPQARQTTTTKWRPAQPAPPPAQPVPEFKPAPAPVNVPVVQYTPAKPSASAPRPVKVENVERAAAPEWHPPEYDDTGVPAWRSSLRSSSGVKPWERDLSFQQQQEEQEAVRSVPFSPVSPSSGAPPQQSGGEEDGPKVVHLQYNSPMGLYSNQNVNETLQGQTQALAGQTRPSNPQQAVDERDWSQSSVLRFIQQQNRREVKQPPPPAPKPQYHQIQIQQQAPSQQYSDEIGASDF